MVTSISEQFESQLMNAEDRQNILALRARCLAELQQIKFEESDLKRRLHAVDILIDGARRDAARSNPNQLDLCLNGS